MEIPKELKDKLERAKFLRQSMEASGDDVPDEEVLDSWGVIQGELVEEFLPIINELCEAGLLNASIEAIDPEAESYRCECAFENGGIHLSAETPHTWRYAEPEKGQCEAFMIVCPGSGYLITNGERYDYGQWDHATVFNWNREGAEDLAKSMTEDTGDEHHVERVIVSQTCLQDSPR